MSDIISNIPNFRYDPLDRTRGSIRLLTVLPNLSVTGLIQCNIWHDTVDTPYACLSYVWGSDLQSQRLLLNGLEIQVHMNLWQFLAVARKKYATPPRPLWIDALCIDQTSFAERGHQVAQMGSIYSEAEEVITWLGHSEAIERALISGQTITTPLFQGLSSVRDLWRLMDTQSKQDFRKDWHHVMFHPYWQRAWITQELLLARKLSFLVNYTEIESERLKGVRPYMYGSREWVRGVVDGRERWDAATHRLKTYLKALHGQNNISDQPLINLFHKLPNRMCKDVHDKVYALLSIASDAASIIVDYERSNEDLIIQLLQIYKNMTCSCYLVYLLDAMRGEIRSEDGNPFEKYGFTITMSATTSNSFMEPDLNFSDRCSACHTKTTPERLSEHLFCLGEACDILRGVHFHLCRDASGQHTLKVDNGSAEQKIISVEIQGRHEYDIDWDTALDDDNEAPVLRQVFKICLSARALGKLLQSSARSQPLVARGLCAKVRKGQGSMVFHEIHTEDMRSTGIVDTYGEAMSTNICL